MVQSPKQTSLPLSVHRPVPKQQTPNGNQQWWNRVGGDDRGVQRVLTLLVLNCRERVHSYVFVAFPGLAEEDRTVVAELGESQDGSSGGDVAQRDGRADWESVLPPAEQQLQIHMRWK